MYSTQHYEEVDSTQDLAFKFLEDNPGEAVLILADHQIQGRGQQKRDWVQVRGRSLSLSLGLELKPQQLSGLSLVVGLAAIECLQSPGLELKWPNDIMHSNDKLGGILVESRTRAAKIELAVGLGLNLFDFDNYRGLGFEVDPHLLAQACFDKLHKFERLGFSVFKEEFESLMWQKGAWVKAEFGGKELRVRLIGVDQQGLLVVELESGALKNLSSGEIKVERALS